MYSVNVPVPWAVQRLAASLEPDLTEFASIRDRHTLVVKRLDGRDLDDLHRIRERLRPALRGVAPFEVRVTGVDAFENPPLGDAPVVYLAVEAVPAGVGGSDDGGGGGAAAEGEEVTAEMQGTILEVNVAEGDEVGAGDVLCVLEAMKMENDIVTERAGTVTHVGVSEGDSVDMGDTLFVLD